MSATVSLNGSVVSPLTYVVLILLIFMWAAVLLPPYLKDRRSSARPFSVRGSSSSSLSAGAALASAQRFLPLERVASTTPSLAHSNVVQLRPHAHAGSVTAGRPTIGAGLPTAGVAARDNNSSPMAAISRDEAALHQAWEGTDSQRLVAPTSTAQARERRRNVLLSLTGLAVVTLLIALMAPSTLFISVHIVADLALVGFAILLVRHRQMAAQRAATVAPIRPAVPTAVPAPIQLAPSYLVSNG